MAWVWGRSLGVALAWGRSLGVALAWGRSLGVALVRGMSLGVALVWGMSLGVVFIWGTCLGETPVGEASLPMFSPFCTMSHRISTPVGVTSTLSGVMRLISKLCPQAVITFDLETGVENRSSGSAEILGEYCNLRSKLPTIGCSEGVWSSSEHAHTDTPEQSIW